MRFSNPWADALVVVLVVLLFFGPKRLPALGKSLGQGMREFKDSITGHHTDDEEPDAISEAGAAPPTPARAPEPESAPVGSSEQRS